MKTLTYHDRSWVKPCCFLQLLKMVNNGEKQELVNLLEHKKWEPPAYAALCQVPTEADKHKFYKKNSGKPCVNLM